MSQITQARSRVATATRYGTTDAADDARRDLRAAKLERAAREAAATLPPLTDEQARRIAAIIYPDGVDAA